MKEIVIGKRTLHIKDYHCAAFDGEHIPRNDNKLWLYVNVTDICNAVCPFCVNPSRANGRNSFSVSVFKQILEKVSPFVYGVSITGGEPMLYPKLVDEVALIVTDIIGTNIELDLVTNGTKLNEIRKLKMLDRFESIHISRHKIDDEGNAVLMRAKTPTIKEIKELVCMLDDPAKVVLNCVMQKGGVSNASEMADYLEMAAWAGVKNTSFVGFFMANQFCKDNYISPASIDLSHDKRFRVWNKFNDYDYCSCSSGDYRAENGNVRFYYRCPGKSGANYCRQLVYAADNKLLDGFDGLEITF
jgi:molybdenum cofactor biosynthesis enzyme MoaA